VGSDDGHERDECEDLHRYGICVYINGLLEGVLTREQGKSKQRYENDSKCDNERMWIKIKQ
jgi:hypothetical protein